MKKTSIFFLLILIISCTAKTDSKKYKYKSGYFTEDQVSETIDTFLKEKNILKANQYIDTLMSQNKKSGFLYYERGFLKGYVLRGKDALFDFQMAKSLGYDNEKCEKMIEATQILINATRN